MAFLGEKQNLTAWCEASKTPALEDGSARPTFWIDETGSGNTEQVGAGSPTFGFNKINGRPAILYDGTTAYDVSTTALSTFIGAAAGTMYCVFKCTTTPTDDATIANNTGLVVAGTVGANLRDAGWVLRNLGGTTPTLYSFGNDGAIQSISIPFTMNEWGIAIWGHTGGQVYVGYNDETDAGLNKIACANIANLTRNVNFAANCKTAPTQFMGGQIAAFLSFSVFQSAQKRASVMNYLRAEFFSANGTIISPLTRSDSGEQARARISDLVWKKRRSTIVLTTSPIPAHRLPAAGLDLAADVSVVYPYGPDPQGGAAPSMPTGWGNANWQRRSMRVRSMLIDLDRKTIQPELRDNRTILVTYASTEVAARSLNLQRQGVLTIGKAPVRSFFRDGFAWVPEVQSGVVVRIDPNQEKLSKSGLLIEPYARNELLRSSFINGTAGLTPTGTGVGGSAIAADASPPVVVFDASVTTNSLKFTAGTPHTTDLYIMHPAFTTPGAIDMYVSIDHYDDSGQALNWWLQRSSDSHYWDDVNANWTSAAIVYNAFPVTPANTNVRDQSKNIPCPASGTLTLRVGLKSGGTSGRINHIFHDQMEDWIYIDNTKHSAGGVTSRIVNDTTANFRGADVLRIYDNNGLIPSGAPWTLKMKFQPIAIAPTTDFAIFGWGNSASANAFLEWNNAGSQLRLNMAAGAAFATVPWTPVVGTVYKLGVRYCPNGEWGNPANQVDVFLGTSSMAKGTGTTRTLNYAGTMIDFSNMLRNANNNGNQQANACGYISSIEISAKAETDAELANW